MKRLVLSGLLALSILCCACGEKPQPKQPELSCSLINSEIAIINHGKLGFYNPQEKCLFYIENEPDSVLIGDYHTDGKFYYCTAVNGRVFLKSLDLNASKPEPEMLADWNLDLNDCLTETYGEMSYLCYFPQNGLFGLWHGFSWDCMDFNDCKLYDPKTGEVSDWKHDYVLYQYYDEDEDESTKEAPKFSYDDFSHIGDDCYFKDVCLTDKMNLKSLASDPDYAVTPQFCCFDVDPTGTMVNFYVTIEQGDFEHGHICVASLDGKFQKALENTDICRGGAVWLSDGSLLFDGQQPRSMDDPDDDDYWDNSKHCVWIMSPNREIAVLSQGIFMVKNKK